MVKSSRGVRFAPRSRPTTLSPALVSSRARIAPVQPTPITTAPVSLSIVAIVVSSCVARSDVPIWYFMHRPPTDHRHERAGIGDLAFLDGEWIGAQDREIGELARFERALPALVESEIGAAAGRAAQCIGAAERFGRGHALPGPVVPA